MAPLRILLHAGFHKTGTTSLQRALFYARDNLQQAGILYPQTGCPDLAPWGQHLLPWSLKHNAADIPSLYGHTEHFDSRRREALWADLRTEIARSGAHTVILSSEEFDTLSDAEIADLAQSLPQGANIHPIISVRNHADFIEGMYRTSVLYHEKTYSIQDYIPLVRSRLDTRDMLVAWSKLCRNPGDFLILNYDAPAVRRDSVGTFFKATRLDQDLLPPGAVIKTNQSLPAYLCECARYMRGLACGEEHIHRFLNRMGRVRYRDPPTHDYVFLPPDLRTDLDARYALECEKMTANGDIRRAFYIGPPQPLLRGQTIRPIVVMTDIAEALLALGRELESKENTPQPIIEPQLQEA